MRKMFSKKLLLGVAVLSGLGVYAEAFDMPPAVQEPVAQEAQESTTCAVAVASLGKRLFGAASAVVQLAVLRSIFRVNLLAIAALGADAGLGADLLLGKSFRLETLDRTKYALFALSFMSINYLGYRILYPHLPRAWNLAMKGIDHDAGERDMNMPSSQPVGSQKTITPPEQ